MYTFAGTAGQTLYLKEIYEGSGGQLEWKLLAPSGAEIARIDMTLDLGLVKLSATGTHIVTVAGPYGGTGTYGFAITAVP